MHRLPFQLVDRRGQALLARLHVAPEFLRLGSSAHGEISAHHFSDSTPAATAVPLGDKSQEGCSCWSGAKAGATLQSAFHLPTIRLAHIQPYQQLKVGRDLAELGEPYLRGRRGLEVRTGPRYPRVSPRGSPSAGRARAGPSCALIGAGRSVAVTTGRTHHRCSVERCLWRIGFSRADSLLIASSGRAASMSFLRGRVILHCVLEIAGYPVSVTG